MAIGWVKSQIGIHGNEEADKAAKVGAAKTSGGEITDGGVKQTTRASREENRMAPDVLCVDKWDRHPAAMYSHLRTGKGNLHSWRFQLRRAESPTYRKCRAAEETGTHIAPGCPEWDRWRTKRLIDGVWRSRET